MSESYFPGGGLIAASGRGTVPHIEASDGPERTVPEDLGVAAVGEAVVGEVDPPGFVGLLCGEHPLSRNAWRCGHGQTWSQPASRRSRQRHLAVSTSSSGSPVQSAAPNASAYAIG